MDHEKFLFRVALARTIGFSLKYDVDPDALLALSGAAPDNTKLPPPTAKTRYSLPHRLSWPTIPSSPSLTHHHPRGYQGGWQLVTPYVTGDSL